MVLDIAQKMVEVLPILRNGVGGIKMPFLKSECGDWTKDYALLDGLFYDISNYDNEFESFDRLKFQDDYENEVKKHFPGCEVKLYWTSQEIEVYRKKEVL